MRVDDSQSIHSFDSSVVIRSKSSKVGIMMYEFLVEVSKSEEGSELTKSSRCWPISNTSKFNRDHRHFSIFDDKPKEFNLCYTEFTFLWFKIEVVFSEEFQDFEGSFGQFLLCFSEN